MGKKKIALVDLSQSDKAQLKASGVRSQKLIIKKSTKAPEVAVPVVEVAPESTPVKTDKKTKTRVKKGHSKRYLEARALIDKTKTYSPTEAISLLRQVSTTKFDPSVELHLLLNINKLSGDLNLPHGTGKTAKVEIATEDTLSKLKAGTIDFDILVAEPKMMPKLAQYAKLLGPKGLMPNPKTNTISDKPEELAKKLAGGSCRFKTEPKAPLIHQVIGKLSFKDTQLLENLTAALQAVQLKNILSCHLCSSMSPSIKVDFQL